MRITVALLILVTASVCYGQYHTNTITTPGGAYAFTVDGGPDTNPTIELQAGVVNILNIQTDFVHPVVITTTPFASDWYGGAAPQAVNAQPIALTTPSSGFPTVLYYVCYYHGFYGQINLSVPTSPVPPQNTILLVQVGTNIVMTSTGVGTTWSFVPEFTSNVVNGVWATIPNFSNTFANGTNTTVFDRLDPICGPNVFFRIRQQKN